MSKVALQSLTRRGGILQGPRLIAALLLITVLVFYWTAPNPDEDEYISYRPVPASERKTYGSGARDYTYDLASHKDRESESLSNKFLDYLGHQRPVTRPRPLSDNPAAPPPTSDPLVDADAVNDPVCNVLAKGTKDILVVIKTPASELYRQLPTRFMTNLRCAPAVLFSYVSQKLGAYDVHDALINVTKKVREKNRDFDLYNRLQTAKRAYGDFTNLAEDAEHNLDRFAIIPTLVAAYKMHPDRKWFAYIEGDTYLSLPNLLAWVGQLDHDIPFYAGAQTLLGSTELGSAAAGLIFSNAALRKLALLYQTKKAEWEILASKRCCGDQVLAEALLEAGISLHRSWPNTQLESPLSIDWSPSHWCRAAVTWHRMTPPLMDMLWQFERNWTLQHEEISIFESQRLEAERAAAQQATSKKWFKRQADPTGTIQYLATATADAFESSSDYPLPTPTAVREPKFSESIGIPPVLYKDFFEGFLIPLITNSNNRTDWDNFSSAVALTDQTRFSGYGHASADGCRAACDIRSKCVQYVYEPGKCRLGTTIRIGEPVSQDKRMKSGWLPHRAKKFAESFPSCGKTLPFHMPDVKDVVPDPEIDLSLLVDDSPDLGDADAAPAAPQAVPAEAQAAQAAPLPQVAPSAPSAVEAAPVAELSNNEVAAPVVVTGDAAEQAAPPQQAAQQAAPAPPAQEPPQMQAEAAQAPAPAS